MKAPEKFLTLKISNLQFEFSRPIYLHFSLCFTTQVLKGPTGIGRSELVKMLITKDSEKYQCPTPCKCKIF